MTSKRILKVLNLFLFVLLINQMAGAFLYHRISHELFEWRHERAGILLAIVIVLHLLLNWNWIRTTYFKSQENRQP